MKKELSVATSVAYSRSSCAIQQLWLRGHEATSVRDLADEMGIGGANLYNPFGGKRALYRSSLNRCLEQTFPRTHPSIGVLAAAPRGDLGLLSRDRRSVAYRQEKAGLHAHQFDA